MGMNFSPMYQPVSTKTIKADGDLNINPYDLLATDVKCDTVEATEFVGGVGNFSSGLISGDLSVDGDLSVAEFGTEILKLPLYLSGTVNTYSFDGLNASGNWNSSVARPVTTFTVPTYTRYIQPLEGIEEFNTTIRIYITSSNNRDGGRVTMKDSNDNVILNYGYLFNTTYTPEITLKYGESYTISFTTAGSYPNGSFTFTIPEYKLYIV